MSPLQEATQLISLVTTPSVLVSGTLLAFAGRAIRENVATVEPLRMTFALGASLAAIGVTASLTWLMAPLMLRHRWSYQGHVEAILVVFSMITLSILGTMIYSVWTAWRCVRELRRPSH
jgi:hypothetical protein